MAELGAIGWERSSDPASAADELSIGDVTVRYGLGGGTEIAVGVTMLDTLRTRDRASGTIDRVSGSGDVTLAAAYNFAGGAGPVAVRAFVTLPTGRAELGAGTWQAGLALPIELPLGSGFELGLTPQVEAAANAAAQGRHLAWGGVIGLSRDVAPDLALEGELAAWRDDDPAGPATDARAALSLAWRAAADWQLDAELELGLTSAAPRHALMFGLARRFR